MVQIIKSHFCEFSIIFEDLQQYFPVQQHFLPRLIERNKRTVAVSNKYRNRIENGILAKTSSRKVYSYPYGIIAKTVKDNEKSLLYGDIAKKSRDFSFIKGSLISR